MAHVPRAPQPARSRRVAAVLLLVAAGAGVVGRSASAQDPKPGDTVAPSGAVTPVTTPDGEPDPKAQLALDATLALAPVDPPPSPDDPFVEPVEARLEEQRLLGVLFDATAQADAAAAVHEEAHRRAVAAAEGQVAATERRDARRATLRRERERLRDLTISAFVNGGDFELLGDQAMLDGDTTDPIAGRMIMFEQVVEHQNAVTEKATEDLAKAEAALRRAIAARQAADTTRESAQQVATQREEARLAAVAAHDAAVADYDATIVRLRNAPRGVPAPLEVPLIGLPRLRAEDLASWFEASPYRSAIATPISDIAAWFIEEGRTEGIRGDVAFVQAVLETGGFTNSDSVLRHNYSGIGHYDNLAAGWTFPSARDGVRAQIQLLKSYAVKQPQYAEPLVDRRLRGPAGCCVSWGDLTKKWATDPTYGPKVMLLYSSLVDHALARRAAGESLDHL